MHSDAAASAKVRKEHEEGRMGGVQVSFTASSAGYYTLLSLACLVGRSRIRAHAFSTAVHGASLGATKAFQSCLLAAATRFFAFVV